MIKAEFKEDIKEIKKLTKEAISYLEGKRKWLEVTLRDLSDLFNRLDTIDGVDELSEDDMESKIKNKLFQNALGELYEFTYQTVNGLRYELEDMDGSKYDYYYDKSEMLQELIDKFDQDLMQYDDLDNLIEHLEEVLDSLNQMSVLLDDS